MGLKEDYKQLNSMLKKINSMPYSTKKISYVDDFLIFCSYMSTAYDLDYFELVDCLPRDYTLQRRNNLKNKQGFIDYSASLNDIILDSLKEVKEDRLFYRDIPRVNKKMMDEVMEDFFHYIGDDVLKFYRELKTKDRIKFIDSDKIGDSGYSYTMINQKSPIIVGERNDYYDYFVIAHEMGHSYMESLMVPFKKVSNFYTLGEVPSVTFEELFLEFLKDNRILDEKRLNDIEHNDIYSIISLFKSVYVYRLFESYVIENDAYDDEIDFDTFTDTILPSIKLNFSDLKEYQRTYALGHIIGSYFIDYMKQDKLNALKEFKTFVMLSDRMTIDEALEQVSSDPIKTKIKTFN